MYVFKIIAYFVNTKYDIPCFKEDFTAYRYYH